MDVLKPAVVRAAALSIVALAASILSSVGTQAGVLQSVRERGHVVCGVSDRLTGLSEVDRSGRWSGLEVEFCGALAAAVFGDRDHVKFRAVSAAEGARALAGGDLDVLLGGTPLTLSREADLGMRFAGVLFYGGQGLLVPRSFGLSSALEASGSSICVRQGTSAETAVGAFFEERQMRAQLVAAAQWADTVKAYKEGSCTLLTGDIAALADERTAMETPADHVILPELVTQEQTGPFVRQGDDPWLTVVRWTLLALIEAEQLGLSSATVQDLAEPLPSAVRRFLGRDAAPGAALGLAQNWTERVIASVGNYGEIFERTLGGRSRLNLPRGANRLWSGGGLMVAPQFR